MSVDEVVSRTRLLESDIKIMKSEVMRIGMLICTFMLNKANKTEL